MYPLHPSVEHILQFFECDHLPPELAMVSEIMGKLANEFAHSLDGPELTVGLRKLLEAKDCFVRASLGKVEGQEGQEGHAPGWEPTPPEDCEGSVDSDSGAA